MLKWAEGHQHAHMHSIFWNKNSNYSQSSLNAHNFLITSYYFYTSLIDTVWIQTYRYIKLSNKIFSISILFHQWHCKWFELNFHTNSFRPILKTFQLQQLTTELVTYYTFNHVYLFSFFDVGQHNNCYNTFLPDYRPEINNRHFYWS